MAAAVAAPAAVATGGPTWDVSVTGTCSGQYSLRLLQNQVGDALVAVAEGLLGLLGLTRATREFTITATEGTVPAGTTFTLAYPNGLIDLTLLQGLLEVNGLGVVTLNNTQATFTLEADLTEGESITLDLLEAIIDLGVASSVTLSLVGDDNPTNPGAEGADSSTITTLAQAGVNIDLNGPLPGGVVTVALQLCA
ncbi:hypothetical protein [Agromyces bauzanensis]